MCQEWFSEFKFIYINYFILILNARVLSKKNDLNDFDQCKFLLPRDYISKSIFKIV